MALALDVNNADLVNNKDDLKWFNYTGSNPTVFIQPIIVL